MMETGEVSSNSPLPGVTPSQVYKSEAPVRDTSQSEAPLSKASQSEALQTKKSEVSPANEGVYSAVSEGLRKVEDKVELEQGSILKKKSPKEDSQNIEEKQKQTEAIVKEQTKDSARRISTSNSLLQFKIKETTDPETGEISRDLVVLIFDSQTGDLLRSVPPEQFYEEIKQFPSHGNYFDRLA